MSALHRSLTVLEHEARFITACGGGPVHPGVTVRHVDVSSWGLVLAVRADRVLVLWTWARP